MTAPLVTATGTQQRLEVGGHGVDVWWDSLDVSPVRLAMLRAMLPPEERRAGERERWEPARFMAARGLVREILGHCLGQDPASLRLRRTSAGKPHLVDPPQAIEFNVSHAGEWLLVAVTRGRAVGVDVERVRLDVDCTSVAAHMFSAGELAVLGALPQAARRRAFFSCWARKEACLKAAGTGLAVAPDRVEVGMQDLWVIHFGNEAWCVRDIPAPQADFVAAVAVRA